jgi:predicted DNA repair protein MutK
MASSLLALLDDITTILDDVAVLTKVATKKTAGVLGDDLALNAQQVAGVDPRRELPVVWAVAKGSFMNKVILVPAALIISALVPMAVGPLLMVGGAFLCFEGVEKLVHKFLHRKEKGEHEGELRQALLDPTVDLMALEKNKIKGAIRTDFILSAEIVVITLGSVAHASIGKRVAVLAGISLIMTIGVYGLVAGIVKLDDLGLALSRRSNGASKAIGALILRAAPWLMKGLSVAGTAAMFLVGGGIVTHGIPALHHFIEDITHGLGDLAATLVSSGLYALVGIAVGAVAVAVVTGVKKLLPRREAAKPAWVRPACGSSLRPHREGDEALPPGPPCSPREERAASSGLHPTIAIAKRTMKCLLRPWERLPRGHSLLCVYLTKICEVNALWRAA